MSELPAVDLRATTCTHVLFLLRPMLTSSSSENSLVGGLFGNMIQIFISKVPESGRVSLKLSLTFTITIIYYEAWECRDLPKGSSGFKTYSFLPSM